MCEKDSLLHKQTVLRGYTHSEDKLREANQKGAQWTSGSCFLSDFRPTSGPNAVPPHGAARKQLVQIRGRVWLVASGLNACELEARDSEGSFIIIAVKCALVLARVAGCLLLAARSKLVCESPNDRRRPCWAARGLSLLSAAELDDLRLKAEGGRAASCKRRPVDRQQLATGSVCGRERERETLMGRPSRELAHQDD